MDSSASKPHAAGQQGIGSDMIVEQQGRWYHPNTVDSHSSVQGRDNPPTATRPVQGMRLCFPVRGPACLSSGAHSEEPWEGGELGKQE